MSEAAKQVHEAGRSGRTSVEEPRCCCRLGTVRGVGTNGSKPPMEVGTELEGEANRMERFTKTGQEGQSYGGKVLPGRTTLLAW